MDDDELQVRMARQHAVEDQRRQGLHGRFRDRHVGDRGEVVIAADEVFDRRQAVLLVGRVQRGAAADVIGDRDAGVLQ